MIAKAMRMQLDRGLGILVPECTVQQARVIKRRNPHMGWIDVARQVGWRGSSHDLERAVEQSYK